MSRTFLKKSAPFRKRVLAHFSLDKQVLVNFKTTCGIIPMSRVIELLIRQWLEQKKKEQKE